LIRSSGERQARSSSPFAASFIQPVLIVKDAMKSIGYTATLLLAVLALALLFTLTRYEQSSNLAVFLPDAETFYDHLLRHQLDNSASSNLVLIALTGLPAHELAELNQKMRDGIIATGLFSRATNNSTSINGEMIEFIERNRYLLTQSEMQEKFTVEGFSQSLEDRLSGLISGSSPLEREFIRQDPTGEVLGLLEFWQGKISRYRQPVERQGVWFSHDGSRTLILSEILADVSNMQNQLDATHAILKVYEEIRIPGLSMILTGPAVFAAETAESIKRDALNLTLIAGMLVLGFLFLAYRSLPCVLIMLLPVASGILMATAVVLLTFGSIHGVTLVFGMTLIGVAIDYPVHMMSAVGSRQRDHKNEIWRTLRLGVISTVLAYSAFLFSDFSGLHQLGVFTISGLLMAAITARWILPAISFRGQGQITGFTGLHERLKQFCTSSGRFRMLVLILPASGLVLLAFGDIQALNLNVDSLSPIKESRRAEDRMLRHDIGVWSGGSMVLVAGSDKQAVLERSESLNRDLTRMVAEGVIEAYDMPSHFLPSRLRQQHNLAALQNTDQIRRNLITAMADTPFSPDVFDLFLSQIREHGAREPITEKDIENTVIGDRLGPLLFDFQGQAVGIILLHGVDDVQAVAEFSNRNEDTYYMNIKNASTDLVTRSLIHVSWTMLGCFLVIYLVLSVGLRSLVQPLRVVIPTVGTCVVTACILACAGYPLSIFHLIALLLVIGLGLDYALFFYRISVNREEWDSTFKSLWVCGTTTSLVFGILAFSSTPPLKAIGMTVAIGTLVNMVFGAIWAAYPTRLKHFQNEGG